MAWITWGLMAGHFQKMDVLIRTMAWLSLDHAARTEGVPVGELVDVHNVDWKMMPVRNLVEMFML